MLANRVVRFRVWGICLTRASKPPHVSGFFMAIYLDEQTGTELKRLLKKEIELHPKNFIAPRLLKMVESDDQRKENIKNCEHSYQPMFGFHDKCNKCTSLSNGAEIWTKDPITIEDIDFIRRKADTEADVS